MAEVSIHSVQQTTAAAAAEKKSNAKLQKAVKEFESVLVGYMLKSLRSTVSKENMFGESFGGDMLEGMFDAELAKHVSSGGNLGIADMLYFKLTGERFPKKAPITIPSFAKSAAAATAKRDSVSLSASERIKNYDAIIERAAEAHGVDSNLVRAVIAAESGGKPAAQSNKNAKGLMQLIDTTASAMGVNNVWDPKQNIFGGTKYLSKMLERYNGNISLATAAYNAGPGNVDKHKGVPPFAETKQYVKRVMSYLEQFKQQELISDDEQ